jgi:hypothetical protein
MFSAKVFPEAPVQQPVLTRELFREGTESAKCSGKGIEMAYALNWPEAPGSHVTITKQ